MVVGSPSSCLRLRAVRSRRRELGHDQLDCWLDRVWAEDASVDQAAFRRGHLELLGCVADDDWHSRRRRLEAGTQGQQVAARDLAGDAPLVEWAQDDGALQQS